MLLNVVCFRVSVYVGVLVVCVVDEFGVVLSVFDL